MSEAHFPDETHEGFLYKKIAFLILGYCEQAKAGLILVLEHCELHPTNIKELNSRVESHSQISA